jgi:large subunit ribosomal protein L29
MTVKEIREKETDHLKEELAQRRKHLFDLRSQAVTEKLEDPSQLRKTRSEIARMKTILRQRELEAHPKQMTRHSRAQKHFAQKHNAAKHEGAKQGSAEKPSGGDATG